jgi:hypothetical protein
MDLSGSYLTEESRTKTDAKVIAYGEKTGHSHYFDEGIVNGGQAILYRELNQRDPSILVIKDGSASLKHQDHLHIRIPQGIYIIKRERSYNPFVSQTQLQMRIRRSGD